jgi:hypothetical protein
MVVARARVVENSRGERGLADQDPGRTGLRPLCGLWACRANPLEQRLGVPALRFEQDRSAIFEISTAAGARLRRLPQASSTRRAPLASRPDRLAKLKHLGSMSFFKGRNVVLGHDLIFAGRSELRFATRGALTTRLLPPQPPFPEKWPSGRSLAEAAAVC